MDFAARSLIWGEESSGAGEEWELCAPATGAPLQTISLLDNTEMATRLLGAGAPPPCRPLSASEIERFCAAFSQELHDLRAPLGEAMAAETAFTPADCAEMLQGTLDFVQCFPAAFRAAQAPAPARVFYDNGGGTPASAAPPRRVIQQTRVPWGTVVVVLPHNAFLVLGVTVLLNALATGNRVILRAPLQSGRSAALLGTALRAAGGPLLEQISVVLMGARAFLQVLCAAQCFPCLLHYLGSARYAPQLLSDAFAAGKPTLIDGEGNTWVWVGPDTPLDTAATILTQGALRYNGQTCTSVNGAMIHPALYPALRTLLRERWSRLRCGDPRAAEGDQVDVGPVFDAAQAQSCQSRVAESGGAILCGGQRDGNQLTPTLVDAPSPRSALVSEGLFGPALWIAPGAAEKFCAWWRERNRYPLCAGVLSPSADAVWWLGQLPDLARLSLNGDPTCESVFEPWGGYGGSGADPVGFWRDKYTRAVQVDQPAPSD